VAARSDYDPAWKPFNAAELGSRLGVLFERERKRERERERERKTKASEGTSRQFSARRTESGARRFCGRPDLITRLNYARAEKGATRGGPVVAIAQWISAATIIGRRQWRYTRVNCARDIISWKSGARARVPVCPIQGFFVYYAALFLRRPTNRIAGR